LNSSRLIQWFGNMLIAITVFPQPAFSQCTPARSPEVESEITHLEAALKIQPKDPVLLYNLAADYAAKCERETTLALLRKVASKGGGLDPDEYRGFAFLKDLPEFRAIVATIRRSNPPKVESLPAFIMQEPDLFPEGMAYAGYSGRIYAGSVKRKIVWTDKSGILHELVKPGQDGLGYVAGLHVDEARKELWAVSSRFGDAPATANMVQGLFRYDLATGRHLATISASTQSGGFLNDVTLVPSSAAAFATNTVEGSVYSTAPDSPELQMFLPAGSVPGANGIALSDDEKILFVAGNFGIYRVNLQTRSVAKLAKAAGVVDGSIDGLYFYRQSLIGIQNGIHPGRVMRFHLDAGLARITRAEVLETYNPRFENPTTGSLDGDSLLFLANTQLHKWSPGKSTPSPAGLQNIQILRLSLKH
jgi:sugar lactone lactonase YvrE